MFCCLVQFVRVIFVVTIWVTISKAQDGFRFANHLADHMVLQRAPQQAKVWGYRPENKPVRLLLTTFAETGELKAEHVRIVYDSTVLWSAILPAKPAGGPYVLEASAQIAGKVVNIQINDVMFGDVWLCGGQSNMEFTVAMAYKGEDEIKLADNYPHIRLFTTVRYASNEPVEELANKNIVQQWSVASSASVHGSNWNYFSAVCWMFGRRLYDTYKIPIGLISSNYGGTPVEAWSSPDALRICNITQSSSDYARPSGDDNVQFTSRSGGSLGGPPQPSVLWNAMINPFLNTTIYGAIWYQGENNWDKHLDKYGCMFSAMIADWRTKWFSGLPERREFPFGFVQLASYPANTTQADDFPLLRWLQTDAYGFAPNPSMPKTFMAVANDLPDSASPYGSIHPRDKYTVAKRLWLGARNIAYGESDVDFEGPYPSAWKSRGEDSNGVLKVSVHFTSDTLLDILVNTGFQFYLQSSTPAKLVWVDAEICGYDKNSVDEVVHVCASVSNHEIVALRYNWNKSPCTYKTCAIYSGNLPAPPFILTEKHRIA